MAVNTLSLDLYKGLRAGFFDIADTGESGEISLGTKGNGICRAVTAGAESRTLQDASELAVGQRLLVVLTTAGDLTILSDDNDITLTVAGDVADFVVSNDGANNVWRSLGHAVYIGDATLPANVLGHGAIGDGVADDTAAIQEAIDQVMAAGGGRVFLPTGNYRITAPLDFTGTTNKLEFCGVSDLSSVITADFTSVSMRAALNLGNPEATRAYVRFHDFRLVGVDDPLTIGIYCEYTGGFTRINNLLVTRFYDGIRVANDTEMKIVDCFCQDNIHNGVTLGLTLADVSAINNNNAIVFGSYNFNGNVGIYAEGCRALALIQCSAESNEVHNIQLSSVFGGHLAGIYMEFDPLTVAVPEEQLFMTGCNGVSVSGLSVSAFDNNGQAIVGIDTCNSIQISGLAIEFPAGGPIHNAIGIELTTALGVTISNSSIQNVTIGVNMTTNARAILDNVAFSDTTNPVITADAAACVLFWRMAITTHVTASTFGAASLVNIDQNDGQRVGVGAFQYFQTTINASDLAAGGHVDLITAPHKMGQWLIADIIAVDVTAFSGGGGNRLLSVTDGTYTWSVIPAATLQSANFQGRWGGTSVPFSATYWHMIQKTTAGQIIRAVYSGGTTDYTAGQLVINMVMQRTD